MFYTHQWGNLSSEQVWCLLWSRFPKKAGCFPNWKISLEIACRRTTFSWKQISSLLTEAQPPLGSSQRGSQNSPGVTLRSHRGSLPPGGPDRKGPRDQKPTLKDKSEEGQAGQSHRAIFWGSLPSCTKPSANSPWCCTAPEVRRVIRCLAWQPFMKYHSCSP